MWKALKFIVGLMVGFYAAYFGIVALVVLLAVGFIQCNETPRVRHLEPAPWQLPLAEPD
jgi:hypothetical protein